MVKRLRIYNTTVQHYCFDDDIEILAKFVQICTNYQAMTYASIQLQIFSNYIDKYKKLAE